MIWGLNSEIQQLQLNSAQLQMASAVGVHEPQEGDNSFSCPWKAQGKTGRREQAVIDLQVFAHRCGVRASNNRVLLYPRAPSCPHLDWPESDLQQSVSTRSKPC